MRCSASLISLVITTVFLVLGSMGAIPLAAEELTPPDVVAFDDSAAGRAEVVDLTLDEVLAQLAAAVCHADPEAEAIRAAADEVLQLVAAETQDPHADGPLGSGGSEHGLCLAIEEARAALLQTPQHASGDPDEEPDVDASGADPEEADWSDAEALSEPFEEHAGGAVDWEGRSLAPNPLGQVAGALDASLQIIARIQEVRAALRTIRDREADGFAFSTRGLHGGPGADDDGMAPEGDSLAAEEESAQEAQGEYPDDDGPVASGAAAERGMGRSAAADEDGGDSAHGLPARTPRPVGAGAAGKVAGKRADAARGRAAAGGGASTPANPAGATRSRADAGGRGDRTAKGKHPAARGDVNAEARQSRKNDRAPATGVEGARSGSPNHSRKTVGDARPHPNDPAASPSRPRQSAADASPWRVTGQVVDADSGQPITDATVTLVGPNSGRALARSDPRGRFAVALAAPGDYWIHVEKRGYGTEKQTVHVVAHRDMAVTMGLHPDRARGSSSPRAHRSTVQPVRTKGK